jgi:hypothetical protein
MVSLRLLLAVPLVALAVSGCSLLNPPGSHTGGTSDAARGADAGLPDAQSVDAARADAAAVDAASVDARLPDAAPLDAGIDAAVVEPDTFEAPRATLRVVHLARDTQEVDVYANDALVTSVLDFAQVSGDPRELAPGAVAFRVTRAGSTSAILERTFEAQPGREYTLALYGDEEMPPFGDRALDLLWLDDDASGLDTTSEVRLAAVHVATPVIAGQLVAVRDSGNLLLADDFAFRGVAPLTLPSAAYVVGFDAGADGTVDLDFSVPALAPGTYANVFVAARVDGSVFLFVTARSGPPIIIDPRPIALPLVRAVHLARDTSDVDVYANGTLLASTLGFAEVSAPRSLAEGPIAFRVTRAGSSDAILERTFPAALGRHYTVVLYGDEDEPPFPDRTLDLLWLDDDASGLDVRRDIRIAAVHVASPVIEGQLVAVREGGNLLLADEFAFRAAPVLTLRSMAYVIGFDAGADGVLDVIFDVPSLVPGTYANVFVAARPDDSVFLLVNTRRGGTVIIEPRRG